MKNIKTAVTSPFYRKADKIIWSSTGGATISNKILENIWIKMERGEFGQFPPQLPLYRDVKRYLINEMGDKMIHFLTRFNTDF